MSFRPVNIPSSQADFDDDNASVHTNKYLAQQHATSRDRTPLPSSQNNAGSRRDSQATGVSSSSTESHNRVFTPPIIERSASNGASGSGQDSSQESQLLQLSQLAAAQEKIADPGHRSSVKRTADGAVKDSRISPGASPGRPSSHSRNVSGVSMASTASSRVTEISSELKTRLSYAMLKVQHGWQARTIDEVETLASRGGSPASSNSTIPAGATSSASPQIQTSSNVPATQNTHSGGMPPPQTDWPRSSASPGPHSTISTSARGARPQDIPTLAPPVAIEPHHSESNARRNSNSKYTPAFLGVKSHQDGPQGSNLPSLQVPAENRNLRVAADPMVISPTHNNREKDAMEALLFMSSPGNSANLKGHFPTSQPVAPLRVGSSLQSTQRTALPTSAPKRKSLPNGRPAPSSQPLPSGHSPKKRVGFGRSPSTLSEMDIGDPSSPRRHTPYARPAVPGTHKVNGTSHTKFAVPSSGGLSKTSRPKPRLSVERLDDVLDRMAAEASSSDSECEIELPVRREHTGMRI